MLSDISTLAVKEQVIRLSLDDKGGPRSSRTRAYLKHASPGAHCHRFKSSWRGGACHPALLYSLS